VSEPRADGDHTAPPSPSHSPGERLIDLIVYAPAGLAVTVVEEFPKLVDKGRHRVEGQVQTARLVGQFALQMGRRQMGQAFERLGADRGARPSTVPGAPSADGARAERMAPPAPTGGHAPARTPPSDAAAGLAIPNYDSLSASQVVQRLDGLSPAALADVRAHEATYRGRRTILHRVEQLLADSGGGRR